MNWTLDDIKPLVASLVKDRLGDLERDMGGGTLEESGDTVGAGLQALFGLFDRLMKRRQVNE